MWSDEQDVLEKMLRTIWTDLSADAVRAYRYSSAPGDLFINSLTRILRTRSRSLMNASELCCKRSLAPSTWNFPSCAGWRMMGISSSSR